MLHWKSAAQHVLRALPGSQKSDKIVDGKVLDLQSTRYLTSIEKKAETKWWWQYSPYFQHMSKDTFNICQKFQKVLSAWYCVMTEISHNLSKDTWPSVLLYIRKEKRKPLVWQ